MSAEAYTEIRTPIIFNPLRRTTTILESSCSAEVLGNSKQQQQLHLLQPRERVHNRVWLAIQTTTTYALDEERQFVCQGNTKYMSKEAKTPTEDLTHTFLGFIWSTAHYSTS